MRRLIERLDRLYYRMKYGFWPTEIWNLDIALAGFLATRLRALAAETQGYPAGYGGWMSGEAEHRAWTADLMRHATSCNRYAKRKFLVSLDDEAVLSYDYKAALKFVAEYVDFLWW